MVLSKDGQVSKMLLKRMFSRSKRLKMNTHRAPSGQELWHLGEAVFPGHYRRLWGLTPDPQGVRAKAAMVCSCHATRGPAEMPVSVIWMDLPTLPIVPRQKLMGVMGRAMVGRIPGEKWWRMVRKEKEECQLASTHTTFSLRANRQDWLLGAVFNGALPPIKGFSC